MSAVPVFGYSRSAGKAVRLAPDHPLPSYPAIGYEAPTGPGSEPDISSYRFWQAAPNLLPDLRTLPPGDLEIESFSTGERHLRLSNTIWNSGRGPLELAGETNLKTRLTTVQQRIYTAAGQNYLHPVGEFVWHPTHDHWHFEDFTIYELWSIDPNGNRLELLASSDKLSYCVIDTDVVASQAAGFRPIKRYSGCGRQLQGLSTGWGDTYKSHLDGQSIEISSIRDGIYSLLSRTNPTGMLVEANLQNNSAELLIKIQGDSVKVVPSAELSENFCLSSGRC